MWLVGPLSILDDSRLYLLYHKFEKSPKNAINTSWQMFLVDGVRMSIGFLFEVFGRRNGLPFGCRRWSG